MNLTKILTGGVQNLDWLEEPETYDVNLHYKKNDVMRELELQWGSNGDASLAEEPSSPLEVVQPSQEEDESVLVVKTARRLIASGRSGSDVVSRLENKFGSKTIKGSVAKLREAFELDGVAGCFAVDCSGFKDCRAAMEHAQKSPYKRFLAFVVNHDSGKDCHKVGRRQAAAMGGSVDGMLADDNSVTASGREYCRTLGLPILSYDGIAPEDTDKTVIDLMSLGHITEKDAKTIRAMKASPFHKMREAFRVASRNIRTAGKKDYSAKVDASVHKIESAPMDFDIAKKMVIQPPQEIDPVNHNDDRELDLEATQDRSSLDVEARGKMSEVEVGGMMMALEDVDPNGQSFGQAVDIDKSAKFEAQSVNRGDGKLADFDVDEEPEYLPQQDVSEVRQRFDDFDVMGLNSVDVDANTDSLFDLDVDDEMDMSALDIDGKGCSQEVDVEDEVEDIDIDPMGFVDKEFEGTDVVNLGEEKSCPCSIEIGGLGDFSF